jgi:hypothetical protein
MSFLVKISEIVEAIDSRTDETTAYLDKRTGEIVAVSEEDLNATEDLEPLEDYPEWQRDNIRIAREILSNEGDFLGLPAKYDIHEYQIMEGFCLSVRSKTISEALWASIKGKRAFRRFKDHVQRLGIADEWYKYREEAIKQIAINWCKSHHIDFEE